MRLVGAPLAWLAEAGFADVCRPGRFNPAQRVRGPALALETPLLGDCGIVVASTAAAAAAVAAGAAAGEAAAAAAAVDPFGSTKNGTSSTGSRT